MARCDSGGMTGIALRPNTEEGFFGSHHATRTSVIGPMLPLRTHAAGNVAPSIIARGGGSPLLGMRSGSSSAIQSLHPATRKAASPTRRHPQLKTVASVRRLSTEVMAWWRIVARAERGLHSRLWSGLAS